MSKNTVKRGNGTKKENTLYVGSMFTSECFIKYLNNAVTNDSQWVQTTQQYTPCVSFIQQKH